MRRISHRGNLTGNDNDDENTMYAIKRAISLGLDVEIDVRWIKDKWYLGHDYADQEIPLKYLIDHRASLWIHCKNKEAIVACQKVPGLHFFWHQEDDYSITSRNWVISYPARPACGEFSVCMLPETLFPLIAIKDIPAYLTENKFSAVCSDFIELLK